MNRQTTTWVKGPLGWSRLDNGRTLTVVRYNAGGDRVGKNVFIVRLNNSEVIEARATTAAAAKRKIDAVLFATDVTEL